MVVASLSRVVDVQDGHFVRQEASRSGPDGERGAAGSRSASRRAPDCRGEGPRGRKGWPSRAWRRGCRWSSGSSMEMMRCVACAQESITGSSWLTPYPTSDSGTGAPERLSARIQSDHAHPSSGRR